MEIHQQQIIDMTKMDSYHLFLNRILTVPLLIKIMKMVDLQAKDQKIDKEQKNKPLIIKMDIAQRVENILTAVPIHNSMHAILMAKNILLNKILKIVTDMKHIRFLLQMEK